jgi:hypothetical protein
VDKAVYADRQKLGENLKEADEPKPAGRFGYFATGFMASCLMIQVCASFASLPKLDDPRCIEPVRIERELFKRQWWGDG